jgi:hypothetical protein
VGGTWVVATDAEPLVLGMRLAHRVPGLWAECRVGRLPAYRKRRLTGSVEECALMAHAIAEYIASDYGPGLWPATALMAAGGEARREASRNFSALLGRVDEFVKVHSRVVIPSLVAVWIPLGAGAPGERARADEWAQAQATRQGVLGEEAHLKLALARSGRPAG